MAGTGSVPRRYDRDHGQTDRQLAALGHFEFEKVDIMDYYDEMNVIGSHAALRRLWIAEGKRRGYELVDE